MSIVPTTYESSTTGRKIVTNQYAVNELLRDMTGKLNPPGLFFKYDIEPIALHITDTRLPFSQFFVRLINIIGGVVFCVNLFYRLGDKTVVRIFGKAAKDDSKEGILDKKEEYSY